MRTSLDALRSMHRFLWRVLENDVPPEWQDEQRSWELRLWGTEGEFGFPFARVAAITPTTHTGSAFVREASRTFAYHLYPVPILLSPEDSLMEVERVEELLTTAFEQGITYVDKPTTDPATWVTVQTAPWRIPLYDYAGVPLDGPTSVSYARSLRDYMTVKSCPINRLPDPEDDRYWLVTAEPRMSWMRAGRVVGGTKLVTSVHVVENPS